MNTRSRTIVRGMALAMVLTIAPATAYAVNVSSSDGNGTQVRDVTYSNGANVSGKLRSTSGDPVYYSGKVANNCSDDEVGRYSPNTTSTSYVNRGGDIVGTIGLWPCSFDGVESRVCRVINNWPDSCGDWSVKY